MAQVERIDVYPVKGLCRCPLDRAGILDGGTLERDREYAIYDADGDVVNGKRTTVVHDVETTFDPDTGTLTVGGPAVDGAAERFSLPGDADRAAELFSSIFGVECTLERDDTNGFVDRRGMGPSVISTATLETIASWFDGMTLDGARRRFRANVEISGVPPFWEDQIVGDAAPSLRIGDVRMDGCTPCGRCVVPSRDPDGGAAIEGFQERFVAKRRETFPEWADASAFDHFYTVMVIASVTDADRGGNIAVGDSVELLPEDA